MNTYLVQQWKLGLAGDCSVPTARDVQSARDARDVQGDRGDQA